MDKSDKGLSDHEYDGIKELDNDLPGWWVLLFWFTIIWGVGYFTYYHFIAPEQTQDNIFQNEMAKAAKELDSRIAASGGRLEIDFPEDTLTHAAAGKKTFTSFCIACHGAQGQGTQCPNLTDNNFLHGYKYEDIIKIITEGSPKNPAMMSWKTMLSSSQIEDVAAYVFTLRGKNIPGKAAEGSAISKEVVAQAKFPKFGASSKETVRVKPLSLEERGKEKYLTCAACHGVNGEGNVALKAPALAGQDEAYLTRQIKHLKNGQRVSKEPVAAGMLPMLASLDEESIKLVVKYIRSFKLPAIVHTLKGDAEKGKVHYATCIACHGAKGEGNPLIKGPKLTGLQDWYILAQLKAFKNGHRGADPTKEPEGAMMAPMAKLLPGEAAMLDVIEYIKTLK